MYRARDRAAPGKRDGGHSKRFWEQGKATLMGPSGLDVTLYFQAYESGDEYSGEVYGDAAFIALPRIHSGEGARVILCIMTKNDLNAIK